MLSPGVCLRHLHRVLTVRPRAVFSDYSASVGSEEESGKDWDELEEEARKGLCHKHTATGATCCAADFMTLHACTVLMLFMWNTYRYMQLCSFFLFLFTCRLLADRESHYEDEETTSKKRKVRSAAPPSKKKRRS